MPIVYDQPSRQTLSSTPSYVDSQYACFLSTDRPEDSETSLKSAAAGRDIDLIVTDAEVFGHRRLEGITASRFLLVAHGFIPPAISVRSNRIVLFVIDTGTNRQSCSVTHLYLGRRHKRVDENRYNAFIDNFVTTVESSS